MNLTDRRGLQLGELFQAVKFLGLIRVRHGAAAQVFQAAIEAVGSLGGAHLLAQGCAGAGDVQQSILLRAVEGHVVVAAHAGIDKLDVDVLADAFDVAVVPGFKGEGRGLAATLFHGAFIGTAAGMRLNAVRLAVSDIHVPAVGLPTRLAGGKMLVGVGNPPVILFPVFVLRGIGVGVAPLPELLDEVVPLFIVRQTLEGLQLLVGDDPAHILINPLLVGPF